jgi:hypothetical protein
MPLNPTQHFLESCPGNQVNHGARLSRSQFCDLNVGSSRYLPNSYALELKSWLIDCRISGARLNCSIDNWTWITSLTIPHHYPSMQPVSLRECTPPTRKGYRCACVYVCTLLCACPLLFFLFWDLDHLYLSIHLQETPRKEKTGEFVKACSNENCYCLVWNAHFGTTKVAHAQWTNVIHAALTCPRFFFLLQLLSRVTGPRFCRHLCAFLAFTPLVIGHTCLFVIKNTIFLLNPPAFWK